MGQPAARAGDMHVCPMVTPGVPPIPHVGGPVLPPCSINVLTGGMPQARVSDMCTCVGPPDIIAMGSTGVLVNSLPAARVGDTTAHGGSIVVGCFTVLIGEISGGGGGGAPGVGKGDSGSGDAQTKSPEISFVHGAVQASTMVTSSANGTPFCLLCFLNSALGG